MEREEYLCVCVREREREKIKREREREKVNVGGEREMEGSRRQGRKCCERLSVRKWLREELEERKTQSMRERETEQEKRKYKERGEEKVMEEMKVLSSLRKQEQKRWIKWSFNRKWILSWKRTLSRVEGWGYDERSRMKETEETALRDWPWN